MPEADGHDHTNDASARRAAHELQLGCGKLAEAAKQARAGTDDADKELGILAEEVIDIATRGLVVTAQVGALALDDHSETKHSQVTLAEVPTVMGLALSDRSKRTWPRAIAPLLQEAVAPLTRAIKDLKGDPRGYGGEVMVLREETIDIEARLAAADARVAKEPERPESPSARSWLGRSEHHRSA